MIRWESNNQKVHLDSNADLCFERKVDPLRILKIFIKISKIGEEEATYWHVDGKVAFSGKEWVFPSFDLDEGEHKTLGIWDFVFQVPNRDRDLAADLDEEVRATLKNQLQHFYNEPLVRLNSYSEETDAEKETIRDVCEIKSDYLKGTTV